MSGLFASGRIVDLVLVLMALEGALLIRHRQRTGRGVPVGGTLAFLASGAFLLLGLRAALVDAPWMWVAAPLAGAGVAHVVDLGLRWRR